MSTFHVYKSGDGRTVGVCARCDLVFSSAEPNEVGAVAEVERMLEFHACKGDNKIHANLKIATAKALHQT